MQKKLDIFVIMPFDSEFDSVYQELIKKPLEAKDHAVKRADDDPECQNIIEEIIQSIWQADLIIADLTERNANVCYELGIAHTLFKPTIQIVQSYDDILFNLHSYNTIRYSIKSDGAPELADRILRIIERDDYKFSNPVNDFTNAGPKKTITIPRSSDIDDGEEVASDDSDISILDARVDVEDAMNEIVSITGKIGLDVSKIGERARAHTEELNKLASNPNQQGIIMRKFASDMNEFSDNVNQKTPALQDAWIKLDQGLEHVLLVINEDQSDYATVPSLLKQMNDFRDEHSEVIKSTEDYRDSYKNLIGLSRDSDPAVHNSVKTIIKTINRLLDELKLGDSVLTRLINLAIDMMDRYEGDMPSNGDDDST